MKIFFLMALLAIALYACKPGIPKNIIQPQEMEKILFDIHVVDGYTGTLPSPDTSKKVAAAYYKGVYKKFGIDSALYHQSLDYYYKNPKLMQKMYDHILDKLSKAKEKQSTLTLKPELVK